MSKYIIEMKGNGPDIKPITIAVQGMTALQVVKMVVEQLTRTQEVPDERD